MKKSRLILFTGLILAFASGASAQLTTLTFDELPNQPVDGLSFMGVTFGFTSADATYGRDLGVSVTFVQDPSLEGTSLGVLTLDFDVPTPTLQFGIVRNSFDPVTPGFTVELFNPSLMSLGSTPVNTISLVGFAEAQFSHDGPLVKRAIITFPEPLLASRFNLDNLTFEGGGPTPAPDLLDLSPEGINLTTGPAGMPDFSFEVLALSGALQGAGSKGLPTFEIGSGSNLVNWTATVRLLSAPQANWLTISPTSGTATPEEPSRVTGQVDAAKLPGPGTYQAEIEVSGSPGEILPVTVVVRAAGARLSVSQNAVLFQSVSNGLPTPSQTLMISNEGDGTLNWSLSGLPSWLTASPESGTASAGGLGAVVSLTADPSSFGSGINTALLTVSAAGASSNPQVVTVVLLTVPGATPATAEVSPNALVFVAEQGQPAPPNQTVSVSNVGGGTLSFNFTATITSPPGGNWLTLVGQGGVAPGQMTILADPSGLSPGVYRATLTGAFGGGAPQEVEVLLIVVTPGSALRTQAVGLPRSAQCAPTGLELLVTTIGNGLSLPVSFPRVLTALVVDDCGSVVDNATLVASVEGLNIPLRPLGTGFYSGTWVPQSGAAEVTLTFNVLHPTFAKVQRSFTVSTAAAPGDVSLPTLFADGVVEGAGFAPRRPLSPGGIISLFGARFAGENNFASQLPLERELAGVSVRIGGEDAPLFFVGPGQINAQVPFEVSSGDNVPVAVNVGGLLTAPQNYLIAPAQPGIFIAGDNAAILDASFQLVTAQNPVHPGDTLQIFCTGLGAVEEQVVTGLPALFSTVELPITVTIGGLEAGIAYQGLAPGFVGLYQVNAVVPSGVEPGDAVSLVLTQNGIVANPDLPVTIPVQAP